MDVLIDYIITINIYEPNWVERAKIQTTTVLITAEVV